MSPSVVSEPFISTSFQEFPVYLDRLSVAREYRRRPAFLQLLCAVNRDPYAPSSTNESSVPVKMVGSAVFACDHESGSQPRSRQETATKRQPKLEYRWTRPA